MRCAAPGHGTTVGDQAGETVPDRRLVVPSLPASIASVRRFAVASCRDSPLAIVCDTVALLVSEIATNALVHGLGDVQVRVGTVGDRLRVEVFDDSPVLPRQRAAGLLEEGGRGLALVESLAAEWGVDRVGAGKVVWFELDPEPSGG